MASTINITRALRVENEAGIVGAETESVNNAQVLSQVIAAGTEEETAMAAFKDHQLQAMALACDVAATAHFLGVRYVTGATVAGPPGTIVTVADLTEFIFPGDVIRLEDCDVAADDGFYLVATVAAALITLENGQALTGGSAVGTVARVCNKTLLGYAYNLVTSTAAGALTFTGDLSDKFAAGDYVVVNNTVGNDGLWLIDSVTYAPPTTTIIVNGGALPGGEAAVGTFTKCLVDYNLPANEPLIWSIGQGMQNPFLGPDSAVDVSPIYGANRGDVADLMVAVAGAINGNFLGRICTDPELP